MIFSLLVIAKEPLPGRVKTRLIGPGVTPEQAAELARCALADTLSALDAFPCQDKVILLEGQPGDWLPAGWTVRAQGIGGLAERLSAGFDAVRNGPAVLVGMDTPQLSPELLEFDPTNYDSCLGMATDGGFWAIGFSDPRQARGCIAGVPMSQPSTGAQQRWRLSAAGLRIQELPTLTDVDDATSADEVSRCAPDSSFAQEWRAVRLEAAEGAA